MFKGKNAHNGTADGFALTKGQVVYTIYTWRYYTVALREEGRTVPKNG